MQPDLVEFKNDEADELVRADQMLDTGRPALIGGMSSIGLFNAPYVSYAILPFTARGRSRWSSFSVSPARQGWRC